MFSFEKSNVTGLDYIFKQLTVLSSSTSIFQNCGRRTERYDKHSDI